MIVAWCRVIDLLVCFHPKPHTLHEVNRLWQGNTLLARDLYCGAVSDYVIEKVQLQPTVLLII